MASSRRRGVQDRSACRLHVGVASTSHPAKFYLLVPPEPLVEPLPAPAAPVPVAPDEAAPVVPLVVPVVVPPAPELPPLVPAVPLPASVPEREQP